MKPWLQAYISLTRIERLGWLILFIVLLLFLAGRLLPGKVSAPVNDASAKRLSDTWTQFHATKKHMAGLQKDSTIILDINLADSLGLLALRGIGPQLAHRIIARRQQLGAYHNYTELWQVYPFSAAVRAELKQHTRIGSGTLNKGM